MSTLCRNLFIFLPKDLADKYALSKLQWRLQKYYDDAVVFETKKGKGKSKSIFSSFITIAEAIQAARQMKSKLNLLELKNDISNMQMNDDQILHRAASILRRDIQSVQLSSNVYPSPAEVSLEISITNNTPSSHDYSSG